MNNQPLVSIIMNCYNGQQYLKEALNSVLKQTYQPLEQSNSNLKIDQKHFSVEKTAFRNKLARIQISIKNLSTLEDLCRQIFPGPH